MQCQIQFKTIFLFIYLKRIFVFFSAEEWRFHRKNLNPSFHYNVVKSFYPTFNKNLKIFVKKMQTCVGKQFRLQNYIQSCAMDMICGKSWPLKCGDNEIVVNIHLFRFRNNTGIRYKDATARESRIFAQCPHHFKYNGTTIFSTLDTAGDAVSFIKIRETILPQRQYIE